MSRFDPQQKLKPYAAQQKKFLTQLMLRRNMITPNDTIGNFPLLISGAAQMYLKQKTKVIEKDSLTVGDFDF